jgi:hypothetical protein
MKIILRFLIMSFCHLLMLHYVLSNFNTISELCQEEGKDVEQENCVRDVKPKLTK